MDGEYMARALELARRGWGWTNPNPLVGAVIVKDGRVVGEGFHRAWGKPHAEREALTAAGEAARGGILYVNLEPCAHYGRTPPCTEAIIAAGIREVVIAMTDPNPLVSGRGVSRLNQAGIITRVGVMAREARQLNEIFSKYITTRQPFVILKTAMTLDGKIATSGGDARWVTGPAAREHVHRLRQRVAAIMVGIGTVLADNPSLTTRLPEGRGKDPVRVIVDTNARLPLGSAVLNQVSAAPTLVAVGEQAPPERIRALEQKGAQVLCLPLQDGGLDLYALMVELGRRDLDSVLLEGGGTLNAAALGSGIVDRIMVFIAPKIVGGRDAPTPVEGKGVPFMAEALPVKELQATWFAGDLLLEGSLERGEVEKCLQD